MLTKTAILQALARFIAQRPGLEFGNYGDAAAYRSEMRSITRARHIAEQLLSYVAIRDSITADRILAAARDRFSGRLSITERADGACVIDYCAGQYFPTEYRKAAAAVLAGAIWDWLRDECMPAPRDGGNGHTYVDTPDGEIIRPGDWLRRAARREFGRTIAARYFN